MEPFVGEIIMFGGNFAPRGYALCDGQLLAISQNQSLFVLLGTTYGGDGRTTFGLPDLRGRVPLHQGDGPGLTNQTIGSRAGVEGVTLSVNQVPAHSHVLKASTDSADAVDPIGKVLATSSPAIYKDGTADAALNGAALGASGGSQPHPNLMPFLSINFCIALVGIFPSRN